MIAHISDDGLNREETVAEHTRKTAYLCAEKGKRCGLSQVMTLCGILHDVGKEKRRFNDYIRADERTRQKQKGTVAHASTGAKWFYDRYHSDSKYISANTKYMVEMISYAIAAHHGLFDCVDTDHGDAFSQKLGTVEDYDEACANAGRNYLEDWEPDKIFGKAAEEFSLVWEKLRGISGRIKPFLLSRYGREAGGMLKECKFFLLSCLQRLMLSLLIDSDWESTSDFMENIDTLLKESPEKPEQIFGKARENFEKYMLEKQRHAADFPMTEKEKIICAARNTLQRECWQFAKHPAGIYRLSIPTGGGKTLSSLAYALEYCRLHPETERIIYVSPFISVTEQNARVFREAIGNEQWILEHHSSVIRSGDTENGDFQWEKASRYEINWEEPFICTTFVQLMNTLFSDKREAVRRMHRLVNAVVIIDEVQSMPLKCVHTFNYMINFLNAVCHTNVILCTATQPALDETQCPICYSEPGDMVVNTADWFRKFERVRIHIPEPNRSYTFGSLGDEIAERTGECRSILVVLNTKSAVRKLYDILKEKKIKTEYLTTNLCPEHRSRKLASIREVLEKGQERIVVVSTNLIEAGVDISFQCVYRSMAGLDSLAQTAGRCNRNGEMEYGDIYFISLEGENVGNMEELQQSIRVTESVLLDFDRKYGRNDSAGGEEENGEASGALLLPEWMDRYYRDIYLSASGKMSFPVEDLATNVVALLSRGVSPLEKKNAMNQAYKTAGRAYRVIDDHSFGVIVPYGKGAELIEAIQQTSDGKKIKSYICQAQRYTVNVRGSQLKKLEGLLQPVSEEIPELYMVAAPGAYSSDYGITPEWETLIF